MQEDRDYVHLQPDFKYAPKAYCTHVVTEEDKPKETIFLEEVSIYCWSTGKTLHVWLEL